MKRAKKPILGIVICLVLIGIGGTAFVLPQYLKIKKDLDRLQTESYDTIFLSMYSTENYAEGDWAHFRAMDIVKTDYIIPNNGVLQKYIETVKASGNTVTTVYLGVDPKEVAKEEIVLMIQQNPTMHFEVVPAYPQIEYWTGMSRERCEELIQNYQTFAEWIIPLDNASLYFFSGEEWLICNPKNYEDTFCTNVAVSKFLMCNFDVQHAYLLNDGNIQEKFDEMRSLIAGYRENPIEYPDASAVDIVFLGDSIIGNYTDTLSVPEVVRGLSGAQVFNCGYGGKGAAKNELTPISFPEIVDALIAKDTTGLPEEAQVTVGMKAFLERKKAGKQLMFVINFGLNDYFNGVLLESHDAYDITSYKGALRAGVRKLQEAYPQAQIVLMTPNFTVYYECGQQQMSEQGSELAEYAAAVLDLAEELHVGVLDNFHELPITEDNWQIYQDDGCHLNERGRFLLGSRIAKIIKTDS